MNARGIRGAITVKKNGRDEIIMATMSLLERMVSVNKIKIEEISMALFSVTKDLNAEFPAVAARKLGWLYVPLLCTNEINVPRSLKKCIRVLLLINTEKKQKQLKHIYLKGARVLRPDIGSKEKGLYYLS